MHKSTNRSAVLLLSLLAISGLSLTTSGCAGADPLTGTWVDPYATTPLPPEIADGDLAVDATLTFDADVAPQAFDLHLDLSFGPLSDTVDLYGTYTDDGDQLTLEVDGFTIDPASGNAASVADDGSRCITMEGFGAAAVCFPRPQGNGYVLSGDRLDVVIEQAIAGSATTQTYLALNRI